MIGSTKTAATVSLQDNSARRAYLESTASADWIARRTESAGRARLLDRLGAGWDEDRALRELVGLDTDAVDAAVRAEILAHVLVDTPGGDG